MDTTTIKILAKTPRTRSRRCAHENFNHIQYYGSLYFNYKTIIYGGKYTYRKQVARASAQSTQILLYSEKFEDQLKKIFL